VERLVQAVYAKDTGTAQGGKEIMATNLITQPIQDMRGLIVSYGQDVFWDSDYTGDIGNSGSIVFYVEEKFMGTTVVMLTVESLGDCVLGEYTAKETAIIVASVIILLFGLAFVFGQYVLPYLESGNLTSISESKNITISYAVERTKYISHEDGFVYQSDSGKDFFIVDMTIKNNGYDSFYTNPVSFYAVADNIKYDVHFYTLSMGKCESVDILDGGTFYGTLIFQIPESTSSQFTLGYDAFLSHYDIVWEAEE
jgi:hypothetical protein